MTPPVDPRVEQLRAAVRDLDAQRVQVVTQAAGRGRRPDLRHLTELDVSAGRLIEELRALTDPVDAPANLPLVLLPVRLETRFESPADAPGTTRLKVRIYPDEVHLDALEPGLTDEEVRAGREWWRTLWPVADAGPQTPEHQSAWAELVGEVGPQRAAWVAHACTPTNRAERGTGEPLFPQPTPRSGRGPIVRGLPDSFTVVALQGGTVSTVTTRPVPRQLPLSPIALGTQADEDVVEAGGLHVPAGAEWTVDFAAAVEKGLAATLTLRGGRAAVDQLFVFGTRSTTTADADADELESLLTAHRFAEGLGLLEQGSPTNNALAERSPYQPGLGPAAPAVDPVAAVTDSDTAALAHHLGIDAGLATALLGHGFDEQAVAAEVNTVLWTPGWGEYLNGLATRGARAVTPGHRESARQLFISAVRGRGPAPALRVGAQPYGVLPVSRLNAWKPRHGETTAGVWAAVSALRHRWEAAVRTVPRLRAGQSGDPADTLLEMLGSSPVMQHLMVRSVVDATAAQALASTEKTTETLEMQKYLTMALYAQLVGIDQQQLAVGYVASPARPLPLPLASDRDPEVLAAIAAGGKPAIDSVLQALAQLAWKSPLMDKAAVAPASHVEPLMQALPLDAATRAQFVSLATGDATLDHGSTAATITRLSAQLAPLAPEEPGPELLLRYQPIAALQTSLAEVALTSSIDQKLAASTSLWLLRVLQWRHETRNAMTALAARSTAARSRAVAEALDSSSHRWDAWATAVVAQRRREQPVTRGLTLGAYGYVEDLRPAGPQRPEGWIHAPSTTHAVTAGMLRSAHLNHLGSAGQGNGPFAIDLSSQRATRAERIIEGVRAGQTLSALLGYQIERGLTGGVARVQLSLRALAPLRSGRLHPDDGESGSQAQEAVSATAVVDGLLLLDTYPPSDQAKLQQLREALRRDPDNPHLTPGSWQPLSDQEWATVVAVLEEAAATLDCVADTMLAESVHQFAAGNEARARTAMDAMSTGAAPADTTDVLEAHEHGDRLTHRVLLLVGATPPQTPSWNPTRPRALAEPRLEAWAGAQLGPASRVVLAMVDGDPVTLQDVGWCALDLVHCRSAEEAVRELALAVPGLAADTVLKPGDPGLAGARSLSEALAVAESVRAVLADAVVLDPTHLQHPHREDSTAEDPDILTSAASELRDRVEKLVKQIQVAVDGAATALQQLTPESEITESQRPDIRTAVLALAALGVAPPALPSAAGSEHPQRDGEPPVRPEAAVLLEWFAAAVAHAGRVDVLWQQSLAARQGNAPDQLKAARAVAAAVFGDGFVLAPLLPSTAASGVRAAALTPAFTPPTPARLRRFLHDHATVRPALRRYTELVMLDRRRGGVRDLRVAQLAGPDVNDAPEPGTTHWLAGPLPERGPWPESPVAHLVLESFGGLDDTEVAGVVIDSWTEDLPEQPDVRMRPDDPQPHRVETGMALRAESASARPPQAILTAVSPDGKAWTSESVRGVIAETMALSQMRLVTLERLLGDAMVLPALYVKHHQLQGSTPHTWSLNGLLEQLKDTHLAQQFYIRMADSDD